MFAATVTVGCVRKLFNIEYQHIIETCDRDPSLLVGQKILQYYLMLLHYSNRTTLDQSLATTVSQRTKAASWSQGKSQIKFWPAGNDIAGNDNPHHKACESSCEIGNCVPH